MISNTQHPQPASIESVPSPNSSFDSSEATDEEVDHMSSDSASYESWHGIVDDNADDSPDQEDSERQGMRLPKQDEVISSEQRGFKIWAREQLDLAANHDPTPAGNPFIVSAETAALLRGPALSQNEPVRGPLGADLPIPSQSLLSGPTMERVATPVIVNRRTEVEAARLLLPILAEEDTIMDHIRHQPVVIICGETGSGKTTQVPQFLYEAGFGSPGNGRSSSPPLCLY